MSGEVPFFKVHCERSVASLTVEEVIALSKMEDDEERIKSMYNKSLDFVVPLVPNGKSYNLACLKKTAGNNRFQLKRLDHAIKEYNDGLMACPQDTEKARELLAILMANRSAIFFENEEYLKAHGDIQFVQDFGTYPKHLLHKILLRKAKCCFKLPSLFKDVVPICIAAKEALQYSKLGMAEIHKKIAEIDDLIKEKEASDMLFYNLEGISKFDMDMKEFSPNLQYPSANECIKFGADTYQGRFAVAVRDILPGTIIVHEAPYCMVISKENIDSNCVFCAKSINNPIPCKSCAYVVYCSLACLEGAVGYHKYECPILATLHDSGVSINCLMALRIVTQKSFSFFWEKKDTMKLPIPSENIYMPDDYDRIYNLCTHKSERPKGEFIHYTFMAIFMLRLLKQTDYFPYETEETLTPQEAFIGSLILHHLQLLQFNAHEISELRHFSDMADGLGFDSAHVGGALFPTLALFNHSCEPSLVRYTRDGKMVVRSTKFIPKGEIVYENYGFRYPFDRREKRQSKLKDSYWFDCKCTPCEENWPLYDEMDYKSLRIPCKHCKHVAIIDRNNESFDFNCDKCSKTTKLFPILMELMKLDKMAEEAYSTFMSKEYETASELYINILKLHYLYLAPPYPDLLKIQQQLRTCMLFEGYKQQGFEN